MDIFTQGLLGATAAQAGAKPNEMRWATLAGFCAPLLADADTFLRSTNDPLLFLENHRHFTHALAFIPVGALLATLLFWPILRKKMGFRRIYWYALLGYATAGLLDACTSYGTHLMWPFNESRTAWSIISIFDPVFSIGLLTAVGAGLAKSRPKAARAGLVFACCYLLLGLLQQHRATSVAMQQAATRGHTVERLIVKPTMGNLLLWRSVYASGDHYYVDAVRAGLPNNSKVFEGDVVPAFNLNRELPQLDSNTVVYRDIQRFAVFSDNYLAWHPGQSDVLGDVRFAMLPTSAHPLWGIRLKLDRPHEHVSYETFRSLSPADRDAFLQLLFE